MLHQWTNPALDCCSDVDDWPRDASAVPSCGNAKAATAKDRFGNA
jgi:hypothetical protein